MRRFKFNIQIKLTIVFIALSTAVLALATFFIYHGLIRQQQEQLRGKILGLAKLASISIDAERLSEIKPEPASQNTPAYQRARATLDKIKDSDLLIDSVYVMIKSDKENIWLFLVDSGDRRKISVACGERYDISRFPQMQQAFKRPGVDKELTVDKWGVFLSGYAPIYNRLGQAAAVVGIDVTADSIRHLQFLLAKRFLWGLIAGVMFSFLLAGLVARGITRPLSSLMEGVGQIGRGNLLHRVRIKAEDELGELAGAFNKMAEQLLEGKNKLQRLYLSTIQSLAQALEAKDAYTKGHSERVTHYAVNIARELGLSGDKIKLLEDLCILHDIGKIGIPEKILTKAGPLTEEEKGIINKHPEIGESILRHIEFLQPGLSIIRDHHERPDGRGYPHKLGVASIPELASVVAVADAFDAMTSDRPYRKALSQQEAIRILRENEGSQFDRRVAEAFIGYLEKQRTA